MTISIILTLSLFILCFISIITKPDNKEECARNCNIARLEKFCLPGHVYCTFDDFEYCSLCDEKKIIASSNKNIYQCVQSENTLCNIGNCRICGQDGSCILCKEGEYSVNGVCQNQNLCQNIPNCVSCIDGKECIRCTVDATLDPTTKSCTKDDNKSYCAEFKYDSIGNKFCNICNLGMIMNYDFKGCRKLGNG